MTRKQRIVLLVFLAVVGGLAILMVDGRRPGLGFQDKATQPDRPALPQSAQGDQAASTAGTRAMRQQVTTATDLKALHDQLLTSDQPGSLLYANFAEAECLLFSSHFGQGAAAWEKFYQQVPEAALDRATRIKAFQFELRRCERFETHSIPAVVAMLKSMFGPEAKDPLARLSHQLLRAKSRPQSVTDGEFASLAASALATHDPEILEALGMAIFARGTRSSSALAAPDEETATLFAWGAAIEQAFGDAPLSYRAMQAAACIVGQGCDGRAVLGTAERKLWDLPPQRSAAILARARSLAPAIRAALDSRSVEAVLALSAM